MAHLHGIRKNIRCNFFNEEGEPLLVDGRLGCPRTSAQCFYVHPDEPIWAQTKPSKPRIDPYGRPYRPVPSVSRASYATRARTPPRTRTPPTSMPPTTRPRSPPIPRSPALGPSVAHSPHHRARTPPRPRSPPSGPRTSLSTTRPRSRSPIRRTPSPRRPPSHERHVSASDSRYVRERTISNASTSAPPRRQDTHPASPNAPSASSSGAAVIRDRSTNGNTAITTRQGSASSDPMRNRSPATPITPVSATGPLEGRSQPIHIITRPQLNGARSQASPPSASVAPSSLSSMPPPPVPPSHSDLALKLTKPPEKELSYTEKRDLWVERIKLLTDATIARNEHLRLTQDMEKYQRLVRSARYSSISDEDKQRLDAQLSDVNMRLNAKKDELNSLLPRLIEADFWGANVNSPPKLDELRKEILDIVAALSKSMEKLHEQYEELRTKGVASLAREAMDIDNTTQAHEGPPVKRRRLSTGGTTSVSNDDRVQQGSSQQGDPHDLDERLKEMEERIAELEISGIERDNNLLDEVEDIVRHQIDAEHRRAKLDALAPKAPATQAPQPQLQLIDTRIGQIEMELKKTGSEVEELAIEVAGLITHMAAREDGHAALAKANEELRERVAALEQQREADTASIEANKAELQALSAAVQSYITQAPMQAPPPPPPPVQQVPSIDEILSKIQPSLIQSVHEDMKPYLKDTHDTVQKILQDQLNNVYGTLVTKMTPTMKTVDIVAQWMERVRRGEPFVDNNPVQSHNAQ